MHLVFLLLFSASLLEATPAEPSRVQADVLVQPMPSPVEGPARLPNLVRGADKALYLTWVEDQEDKSSKLRLSSWVEGQWSIPVDIVQSRELFLNWADFPGVSALTDGTLLAYWLKRDGTRRGYTAQVSLSTDHGKSWSPERPLHEDRTSGEHGFVSVVPLDDSQFLAVWLDGREAGPGEHGDQHGARSMKLYSRTISRSGEFGAEQVIDDRICDCCQTSLTRAADGRVLVAYRDRDAEEVRDISLSWRDATGWSKPANLRRDGWMIPGCPVNGPQVASSNERIFAAWYTGAGPNGGQVYAAVSNGTQPGFGFPVAVDSGSPVGRVDIEALGEQTALVTWLEQTEASHAEWRIQRIAPGKRLGEPVTLGQVPNNRVSGFLRLAPMDGGYAAVWTIPGEPYDLELVSISVRAPSEK